MSSVQLGLEYGHDTTSNAAAVRVPLAIGKRVQCSSQQSIRGFQTRGSVIVGFSVNALSITQELIRHT